MRSLASLDSSIALEEIATAYLIPSKSKIRGTLGDLSSLVASIREKGLIEPLLVRPKDGGFEIVCGHRRFEACKKLRMKSVPCVVKYFSDQRAFEISLIENIQRESLNPIDEAVAYHRYVVQRGWGGVSKLARRIGMSEEYVSHHLLLLSLPKEVQSKVSDGTLNFTKARELVWLKDPKLQTELLREIMARRLSTRKVHTAAVSVKNGIKVDEAVAGVDRADPWDRGYREAEPDPDYLVMEKAIVALRISMMKMDSIIELASNRQLKEYLVQVRYNMHDLIDKSLRRRKEMWP